VTRTRFASVRRVLAALPPIVACFGASAGLACAQTAAAAPATSNRPARVELQVDNDLFAPGRGERWYTSGVFLRGYWPAAAGGAADGIASWWCLQTRCGTGARHVLVLSVGQQLYTPATPWKSTPQPDDRPYAAWLFGSAAVLSEDARGAQLLGLRAGVIGPGAQGEAAQNTVHRLLAQKPAGGWAYQRRSLVGLQLDYSGLASRPLASDLDVVGRFAATAGSAAVQTSVGAVLRWGSLPGIPTYPNQPTLTRLNHAAGDWHVFTGGELRLVGRDRLVDGPVEGYASRVRARSFVPEFMAGVSVALTPRWQLEFTVTVRAPEFEADHEPLRLRPQQFGSILLRWTS
jgi:lipid A 3-O-deacylase